MLRLLASRCRTAPLYTWSMKTQSPAMACLHTTTTTTWYIRPPPMTAVASRSYAKDTKNDSPIQPPNIKLPNRDQVEKYFFTALVYIWDFAYYVFCLSLKLIDNYIVKNSTVQLYWKRLIKRLDEQREAIKSKK